MNPHSQGRGHLEQRPTCFLKDSKKCYTIHRVTKITAMERPNVSEHVAQLKCSNIAVD